MGRLRILSELAQDVFKENTDIAQKLKVKEVICRYVTAVVKVNMVFDLLTYDRQTKRFFVDLTLPEGKSYIVDGMICHNAVFCDKTTHKRFLIHNNC